MSSINAYTTLEQYFIGKEKGDRQNTIHQLAVEINPDISDSDADDRAKTFTEVAEYIERADGHQLAMLREHMSSMSHSEDSEDSDSEENCTELDRLNFVYENPPRNVYIGVNKFNITDPSGKHDFAINYNCAKTGTSTLDGSSVKQILDLAKTHDGEIMFEIFLISECRHTDTSVYPSDGEYNVTFPNYQNHPEFNGLRWTLKKIDDDCDNNPSWEMHAVYKIEE